MTIHVAMTVNGKSVSGEVEARTLLVQFLREHLGLTGTHVGCDTSQCGACTVHVDGQSVKSCTMLAVQAEGAQGDDHRGPGRERRQAASDAGGVPREPRAAVRLLHAGHGDERHRPGEAPQLPADEATVRRELEGNLCRCTGYHNIVKAILAGRARHEVSRGVTP